MLHRFVRLRWGFLDEVIGVDWAHEGDPWLGGILQLARESEAPVEVVLGNAPGFSEPWSRAIRAHVDDLAPWSVILRHASGEFLGLRETFNLVEAQAARALGAHLDPWRSGQRW